MPCVPSAASEKESSHRLTAVGVPFLQPHRVESVVHVPDEIVSCFLHLDIPDRWIYLLGIVLCYESGGL